jgi:hypothetical protein
VRYVNFDPICSVLVLYRSAGNETSDRCFGYYHVKDLPVFVFLIPTFISGSYRTLYPANLGRPMHQLYPEHAKALQRAGLSSNRLPTLRQVLDCRSGSQGRSRSRSATESRAVFFCLGFSKFWKTPIHVLLRRLRNKHNLLRLRVSMSYHRFNNLRELFQGHLNKVLLRFGRSSGPPL